MPLGKIARLPHAIREQLNERLENHEPSQPILEWLNALPEVRETLAELFYGKPINKQNLSEWRQGGYREWQSRREALNHVPEAFAQASEIRDAAGVPIADTVSDWGACYYLLTARRMLETGDSSSNLKLLQRLLRDGVALQRGTYRTGRLKLDNERLDFFKTRETVRSVDFVNTILESLPSRHPLATPSGESKESNTVKVSQS